MLKALTLKKTNTCSLRFLFLEWRLALFESHWNAMVEILRPPLVLLYRVLRHLTVTLMPRRIKWVTGDRHR